MARNSNFTSHPVPSRLQGSPTGPVSHHKHLLCVLLIVAQLTLTALLATQASAQSELESENSTLSQHLEARYQQAIARFHRLEEQTKKHSIHHSSEIDGFRLTFNGDSSEHDLFRNQTPSPEYPVEHIREFRFSRPTPSRASHNPGDAFETSSLGRFSQTAARGTAALVKNIYNKYLAPRAAQADDGEQASQTSNQEGMRHRTLDEIEALVKVKKNYEIDALDHF